MELHTNPEPIQDRKPAQDGRVSRTTLWVVLAVAIVALAAAVVFGLLALRADNKARQQFSENEQILLDMAQQQLEEDYANLNEEFAMFENSRQYIVDDSVKRELNEKYETARLQVEKLQQELKNQKNKSAAEIAKLKDEISTLRNLLKHYVEEIDRLNKENAALRTENEEIKTQNQRLNTQVTQTTEQNERLAERMVLAEKLNVTGVSLTPLNKKGRDEKKVEKATQLMVTFTIPQNNSTPVGEKTFYLRLVSPSGQLLGNAGTFSFEGGQVACSAKKTVEYAGEEIGGVKIYWDVTTALTAGSYTVELFVDNYRVASRKFDLK